MINFNFHEVICINSLTYSYCTNNIEELILTNDKIQLKQKQSNIEIINKSKTQINDKQKQILKELELIQTEKKDNDKLTEQLEKLTNQKEELIKNNSQFESDKNY